MTVIVTTSISVRFSLHASFLSLHLWHLPSPCSIRHILISKLNIYLIEINFVSPKPIPWDIVFSYFICFWDFVIFLLLTGTSFTSSSWVTNSYTSRFRSCQVFQQTVLDLPSHWVKWSSIILYLWYAMECTCLCYGSYTILVYFPEYNFVKYLKARTIVFFFVFPIPKKMLAHYRKKSVCCKEINTQLMNFSASSVKGHGGR